MALEELLQSRRANVITNSTQIFALAYIRVSHERSAEKNISPETQRQAILKYADEKGYEVIAWYEDMGKSAFKNEAARTGFLRMIEDAKTDAETTVILVFRFDRFSRSWNSMSYQADLRQHGVRVESVEEGYFDPDSEIGAIMNPLNMGLSRYQSIKLRNVVTPNMLTNAQHRDPDTGWAYKNGGIAMWGYKTHRVKIGRSDRYMDIHKAYWVLDDTVVAGKPIWEWAKIMLLEWRLRQRMGYRMIADKLTKLGIPTPSGKQGWSSSTINSLVADFDKLYQYAGYGFWYRRNCQSGRAQGRDTSEWVVVENAHRDIISEEECEQILALAQHAPQATHPRTKPKSRFILSNGLVKCSHCGSNFAGAKRHGGDYYVCGSHLYRRGAGCGPSWYVPKDELENLIFSQLLNRASNGSIEALVKRFNDAEASAWTSLQKTGGERKRKITELEMELQNLLDVAATGALAPEITQRIKGVSEALTELRHDDALSKPAKITVEEVKANFAEIEAGYASVDSESRKLVMRDYLVELLLDSEEKIVKGRLRDPLSRPNDNGEPDQIDLDSPVYRNMVGQGTTNKTELMFD